MIKGNKKQEEKKQYIMNEIKEHKKKIRFLENKINNINNNISKDCIQLYGSHNFKEENEDGPYPETFCVCINCGYEP